MNKLIKKVICKIKSHDWLLIGLDASGFPYEISVVDGTYRQCQRCKRKEDVL